MSSIDACALVALVAMTFYAVLGGADFGGGFFHLLALGSRSRERRKAIAEAMGPVWEGNHVFLILLVVVFFSAFPRAWAAYATALAVPLRIALIALSVRGVAFVFRSYAGPRMRAGFGAAFGVASIVSPWVLGASVGAVSAGALDLGAPAEATQLGAWLAPLPVAMAFTALAVCVHLAAVFLAAETTGALRADFRLRALLSGLSVAIAAIGTLLVARISAPHLYAGLAGPRAAVPLVAGSCAWVGVMLTLLAGRVRLARAAVVVAVAALVSGWATAQHPYLIYPHITLAQAAAPEPMLRFLLATLPFGVLLVGPSMWLAFRVFKARPDRIRRELELGASTEQDVLGS